MLPQVESWFTNTGRGLLTILLFGMMYQLLDIRLLTTTIKIPAFPEILINNASGLQQLYVLFLIYAVYRYSLHNAEALKIVLNKALAIYLIRGKGQILFGDVLSDPSVKCEYSVGTSQLNDYGFVSVKAYPSGLDASGYNINYKLAFSDWKSVDISVDCNSDIAQLMEENFASQGLRMKDFTQAPQNRLELNIHKISGMVNTRLVFMSYWYYLRAVLSEKTSFDAGFPLISCALMALFNLYELACATFGA